MKILVVFGSKSDETVATPLVQALSKDFEVEYEAISAHRDLEKLQRKIATWKGDAIIAGAGLAAALPGVVAAMSRLPVFGVPVNSQFGGMDSLASIAQMPPGVPVLTCGPDKTDAIVSFLKLYKKQKSAISKVNFVTSRPDAAAEIEKAKKLGSEKGLEVISSSQKRDDSFNVYLVTEEKDIHADEYCLHLPFFTKSDVDKPETYLTVLKWANKGGLWVGANNTRNAVQSALRLSSLPEILYQGSVKNVRGVKGQSPYVFEFSDRYSIFDWGQMPDQLNGKGESLAFMGSFFFDFLGKAENWKNWKAPASFEKAPLLQTLKEHGSFHHGLGLLEGNPRCLAVKPVQVIEPASSSEGGKLHWDYTAYKQRPENALVPLEVIFRFGVPEGSSLLKRTSDSKYCQVIGLQTPPKSGDRFEIPVVEYSTKLETSDRYISYDEAQTIAGLSAEEFGELSALTKLLALRLKDCFAGIGLELWDGKFEFGFTAKDKAGKRGFMLVDSIGPDELRLTRDDVHLSKEALRGYYRHTPWYAGIEKAKELAHQRGSKEWKEICTDELKLLPPPLNQSVREQVEMVYKGIVKALSQKYGSQVVYPEAWSLDDVVKGFKVQKKEVA
jgi:phosphoribosylaminoimidazole-succinocarboxamide synthase